MTRRGGDDIAIGATVSAEPIRVLLGGRFPFFESAVASVLTEREGFVVTASRVPLDQLATVAHEASADIIVLDPCMSFARLSDLGAKCPAPVLALAHDPPDGYGRCLVAVGVSCVTTAVPLPQMSRAVAHVANIGPVFVAGDGTAKWQLSTLLAQLTPRERDVLKALSTGATFEKIGDEVSLHPETVRKHAERIRAKVGVSRSRQFGDILRMRS